jgi:hypothetical protein
LHVSSKGHGRWLQAENEIIIPLDKYVFLESRGTGGYRAASCSRSERLASGIARLITL